MKGSKVFLWWGLRLPFFLLLLFFLFIMLTSTMSYHFACEACSFLHQILSFLCGHGIDIHGIGVPLFLSPSIGVVAVAGAGFGGGRFGILPFSAESFNNFHGLSVVAIDLNCLFRPFVDGGRDFIKE